MPGRGDIVAGNGGHVSYFPPPPGLPYATPEIPAPSPRPTSVTVLAIIAIVFGSLAVLGTLCSLFPYLGVQFTPNPVIDATRKDPLLLGYNLVSLVLGMVLGAVLLVGGISSLSLKPIGRRLMMGYAVVYLVISIPSAILNVAVITPRLLNHVQNLGSNPQLKTVLSYSAYLGVAMVLVFLIWPILILYYMTRPHVKSAFERGM